MSAADGAQLWCVAGSIRPTCNCMLFKHAAYVLERPLDLVQFPLGCFATTLHGRVVEWGPSLQAVCCCPVCAGVVGSSSMCSSVVSLGVAVMHQEAHTGLLSRQHQPVVLLCMNLVCHSASMTACEVAWSAVYDIVAHIACGMSQSVAGRGAQHRDERQVSRPGRALHIWLRRDVFVQPWQSRTVNDLGPMSFQHVSSSIRPQVRGTCTHFMLP
jgi:hypothetical protein